MAAESVTSVLLIDFDGVRRSLNAIDVEAGDQLAASAGRWLEALENGDLISPSGPRRILLRRCFADPDMLGDGSKAMADSGFDVIDSPARKGGHSGAELHFAIDAVDALNDNVDYAEFILLSPDANLTPLLARLKGADRRTVVYSDDELTVKQRRLADAVLTSEALAAFITGSDSRARAPDRAKIEAFARKISSVTSIPLLTPKTYAELVRQLSVEITTNGYDFQTTARRVADRLSAIGRNVARRQVVFVVKGLALKGHVFSNDDTPRRLAEVFREQARYLIGNTGTPLDAGEERLLSAWLVDRTRKRVTGGKATTKAKVATTPKAAASKADSNAETPQPKKAKRSRKQKAEAEAGLPDKPAEGDLTGPIIDDQPRRTMRTAAQVKAEIAARIASSVRDRKTAAAMSVDGKPPPKSKKPTREDAVAGQPNAQKSASEDGGDSGEAGANERTPRNRRVRTVVTAVRLAPTNNWRTPSWRRSQRRSTSWSRAPTV